MDHEVKTIYYLHKRQSVLYWFTLYGLEGENIQINSTLTTGTLTKLSFKNNMIKQRQKYNYKFQVYWFQI